MAIAHPIGCDKKLVCSSRNKDLTVWVLQNRRRRRESIAREAQDSWQHLQLYLQGCQAFAEDEATSTALQRHLLRTTATSLLDWLLHYQVCPAPCTCILLPFPSRT